MSLRKCPIAIATLLLISACGGGGGGDGFGAPSGPGGGSGVTPVNPGDVNFTEDYVAEGKSLLPYPTTWDKENVPGEPEILSLYAERPSGVSDPFRENFALIKLAGSNLRDSSGISNIQQVSSRAVTIDGLAGTETVFDGSVSGVSIALRFMEISFEYGGTTIGLLYSGERADFNRNIDVVRYVAQQWRVGQVIFDNLFLGSDFETPGNTPIANDGSNFLVVSCRESGDFPYPAELIGRLIGPDRQAIGPEILINANVDTGNTGCNFTRPRITFDGGNFMVTYMADINDRRHIVAKRISTAGQLLDSTPIDVSGSFPGAMFEPAAVYTGSQHLIVWHHDVSNTNNDEVLGAFVNPDGSVSNTFVVFDQLPALYPDQFGNFYSRPEVALGPDQIIVTLAPRFEREPREPTRPIYAQLLNLNGGVLLASPVLVREDNGDNPRYIQVASDGQSYFVAWIEGLLDEGSISSGTFGIYGRQINTAGQLVNGNASTLGLEIAPPSTDLPKEDLNLSFADNQFFLFWSNTTSGTNRGIYGNRVSADLSEVSPATAVGPTSDISPGGQFPRHSHPAMSRTSTGSLLVWPSRDGSVDGWTLPPESP